jgi:hypothetical protein
LINHLAFYRRLTPFSVHNWALTFSRINRSRISGWFSQN